MTELCPQTEEVYDRFRRVTFRQAGILEDDALAERLSGHRQVLCVVNSRKAAQQIFDRLPQEGSFHLSTLMIPAQRQAILGGNSAETEGRASRAAWCLHP